MGLMEDLGNMLGGDQEVQRMANGQANFDDPNSPDRDRFGKMAEHASPADLESVISQATQQSDPSEFADHVTPGVNGTNPLGEVGRGGLTTIASALVSQLGAEGGQGAAGEGQGFLGGLLGGNRGGGGGGILGKILGGGGGGGLGGLLGGGGGGGASAGGGGGIPGVRTLDPNQMDESQVAALAEWMRRNHPEAFNRAATQVGRENPSLLSKLMNNKMLMIAAAGLAAKIFMNRRQQQ